MKKLIFLSFLNDSAQVGGAALRVAALVEIYRKLGFQVDIKHMSDLDPRATLKSLWSRFYYGVNVGILFSKADLDLSEYDLIHFDNLRFFNWNIKKKPATRIFYNAHNLEFESYFNRSTPLKHISKFQNYELGCMKKCDLVWVCSEREKEIISNLEETLRKKVHVVPNLVNKNNYSAANHKNKIIFLGALDYYPNIKAVHYLCDKLAPTIPPELKKRYQFIIAGKSPSTELVAKCKQAGFFCLPNLSAHEVRMLLAETLISLVPLDHGSGTRLMIIESIFSGAKVLSTELGAEGFASNMIRVSPLEKFSDNLLEAINDKEWLRIKHDELFNKQFDIDSWFNDNQNNFSKILNTIN